MDEYIQKLREMYPMYSDLSDDQLLEGVHRASYSDMDYGEFIQKLGGTSGEGQPESSLGRKLALAGRAGLQGLAGLAALPYDVGMLAYNTTGRLTGAPKGEYSFGAISDALSGVGFPEPETKGERFATNAIAATTAAVTPAGIARAVPSAARFLGAAAQAPVAQAAAASTGSLTADELIERGVDPRLALAMSLGTGIAAGSATGRATNAMRGNYRSPEAAQFIDDAAQEGVRIRPGDVPGATRGLRGLEDRIADGPGGSAGRFLTGQVDDATGAVNRFVDDLRPGDLADAGTANRVIVNDLRDQYTQAKANVRPLFQRAEELAGDSYVPLDQTREAVAEANRIAQGAARGSGVADQIAYVEEAVAGPLTYQQARALSSEVGSIVEQLRTTPGANERALGSMSRLYGAIGKDVDSWAATAGEAGAAHSAAMQAFRETVAPFRSNSRIYRIARGRDDLQGADRFLEGVLGRENSEAGALLSQLLSPEGNRAAAFQIVNRAAANNIGNVEKGSEFLRGSFNSQVNLGTTQNPTGQRRIFQGAGVEDRAERVQRLVNGIDRANSSRVQPRTGFRNFGAVEAGRSGLLGAAAGSMLGFDPWMTGAAATLGAAPVNNMIFSGLSNTPVTRYLSAQSAQPIFGAGMGVMPRGR